LKDIFIPQNPALIIMPEKNQTIKAEGLFCPAKYKVVN